VDWAADPTNSIAAFNIADGLWTEIPPPEGRTRIFVHSILLTDFGHKSHRQRDAQEYLLQVYVKVVVEQPKFDYVRIWMLNEAQKWNMVWATLEWFDKMPLSVTSQSDSEQQCVDNDNWLENECVHI
jgi:hypothetical protein